MFSSPSYCFHGSCWLGSIIKIIFFVMMLCSFAAKHQKYFVVLEALPKLGACKKKKCWVYLWLAVL